MMLLQVAQAAAKPETIGLGSLILAGGWLMIPLALLSAISIFIFFERFWMIRQASGKTDAGFMAKIRDLVYEGKAEQAIQFCRAKRSPVARMIEKGLMNLGRSKADVQAAIENVANLEVSRLESGLPFLATTAGGGADDRVPGNGAGDGAGVHGYGGGRGVGGPLYLGERDVYGDDYDGGGACGGDSGLLRL